MNYLDLFLKQFHADPYGTVIGSLACLLIFVGTILYSFAHIRLVLEIKKYRKKFED